MSQHFDPPVPDETPGGWIVGLGTLVILAVCVWVFGC